MRIWDPESFWPWIRDKHLWSATLCLIFVPVPSFSSSIRIYLGPWIRIRKCQYGPPPLPKKIGLYKYRYPKAQFCNKKVSFSVYNMWIRIRIHWIKIRNTVGTCVGPPGAGGRVLWRPGPSVPPASPIRIPDSRWRQTASPATADWTQKSTSQQMLSLTVLILALFQR